MRELERLRRAPAKAFVHPLLSDVQHHVRGHAGGWPAGASGTPPQAPSPVWQRAMHSIYAPV